MIASAASRRRQRRQFVSHKRLSLPLLGLLFGGIVSAWLLLASTGDSSAPPPPQGTPVFAVLKANQVNVRRGPSFEHAVQWVYNRRGVPVAILERYEHWRRIRDMDGDTGWVHFSLLDTSARGAIVRAAPAHNDTPHNTFHNDDGLLPLRARARDNARIVALLQPGVVLEALECRPHWCRVEIEERRGWVARAAVWGIALEELF